MNIILALVINLKINYNTITSPPKVLIEYIHCTAKAYAYAIA